MKKAGQITAFYLEVLLLALGLILIVLVLTQVFALGRLQSASAVELTDAVCLAQNAAEAVSSSRSPEELLRKLDEGNAAFAEEKAVPTICAGYDARLQPVSGGALLLHVTWESEDADKGELVHSTITVTDSTGEREIYTLQTAVFVKEAVG